MIPVGVDIYFGTEPIDLRWGFDRLCGVITERVGRRPRSGAVFVFFGKRPRPRDGAACARAEQARARV